MNGCKSALPMFQTLSLVSTSHGNNTVHQSFFNSAQLRHKSTHISKQWSLKVIQTSDSQGCEVRLDSAWIILFSRNGRDTSAAVAAAAAAAAALVRARMTIRNKYTLQNTRLAFKRKPIPGCGVGNAAQHDPTL